MMHRTHNLNVQEESDLRKLADLFMRHYKIFILCVLFALFIAYLINHFAKPVYEITASVLIKEEVRGNSNRDVNDFLNSSLFGRNHNFQNEVWVIQSSPVLEQTIRNLDLSVGYYTKNGFTLLDSYKKVPFKVSYMSDHAQPIDVKFYVSVLNNELIQINA
ncbi:MAG: hypothetical protein JW894_03855, partial [Bacteroidales bacterium]|nr:hypothetical protein [Bacteroidales bacterium]